MTKECNNNICLYNYDAKLEQCPVCQTKNVDPSSCEHEPYTSSDVWWNFCHKCGSGIKPTGWVLSGTRNEP